jgi:hypothetical protein
MASKGVKKFSLLLDYSKGKFGIAFEHSESEKPELYVGSALEPIAFAYLMQNSQYIHYEAMKKWPDLNKLEPSFSTGSPNVMEGIMKNLEGQK